MDRINALCSYLERCENFADVACDHGYCTKYMLDNGLCKSAVVSDISAASLLKAQCLLKDYIEIGLCSSVCCDGLEKIKGADEVLIAGIGGEEIVKILKTSYIPESFVLQPMKNAKALRVFLLENKCEITLDDIFSDGKNYYFIIKGNRQGKSQSYSRAQLEYGKGSLTNPLLKSYLECELLKKQSYLSRNMSAGSRTEIERSADFIREVLREIN